jgi:hypothetical protein
LLQTEGKRSFGSEVDIPFTCEIGDSRSSAGANGTAYESSLTATSDCSDQCTAASATCDPSEVALLVAAAGALTGRGAQVVGLAVNLNSIENQAKMRPPYQVS